MARHKIAMEFKDRHLSRPMLDQIVGAQLRAIPDASEIIIRCRVAAKTVYEALDSYGIRITIIAREQAPQDL
jgi:hypothetical protein